MHWIGPDEPGPLGVAHPPPPDNALFTASEDRQGEYRVLAAPIGLANDRQ
jgi:hypothetical protein